MILEFITEKPSNAGAWKAINKLEEFTLVQKVLLWLNIVLTYDFKSLKKNTLNIITPHNIEEYCEGLIEVLSQELDLIVNPKIEALKISKPFGTTYDECLMGVLEMIYKDTPTHNTKSLISNLSTGKDIELTNASIQLFMGTVTPITVAILHSTNVFFKERFRKHFIPTNSQEIIILDNESNIRPYLVNKLLEASKKGKTSTVLPTIKLKHNDGV